LLLILGLMGLDSPPKQAPKIIEAAVVQERPQEELVQKLEQRTTPSQALTPSAASASAPSSFGVPGSVVAAAVTAPKLNTTTVNRPTSVRVDVGAVNIFTQSGGSLAAPAPEGTLGEALASSSGYGDAMDRITQEILNKLAKGKVLVVWIFDQSGSMKDD